MKTKEELNALKQKYDEVKSELRQLTDEELAQVVGGNNLYESISPIFITNYTVDCKGPDVSTNYTLYLPINAIVTNTTVTKQIIDLFPLSD